MLGIPPKDEHQRTENPAKHSLPTGHAKRHEPVDIVLLDLSQPVPRGLGSDFDTVRRFLVSDEEALRLWDDATQRADGGANNPYGRAGKPETTDEITVDNIHGDKIDDTDPKRPAGNSAQAGMRRLQKAAEAGDEKAADLLARIGKAILCRQWRHYLGRQGYG